MCKSVVDWGRAAQPFYCDPMRSWWCRHAAEILWCVLRLPCYPPPATQPNYRRKLCKRPTSNWDNALIQQLRFCRQHVTCWVFPVQKSLGGGEKRKIYVINHGALYVLLCHFKSTAHTKKFARKYMGKICLSWIGLIRWENQWQYLGPNFLRIFWAFRVYCGSVPTSLDVLIKWHLAIYSGGPIEVATDT